MLTLLLSNNSQQQYKSQIFPHLIQIKTFLHPRNMKVLIILWSVLCVCWGSLEPSGYRSVDSTGSQLSVDQYLPPSITSSHQGLTPESHYLPTSSNPMPNSLYLPSNHHHGTSNSPSMLTNSIQQQQQQHQYSKPVQTPSNHISIQTPLLNHHRIPTLDQSSIPNKPSINQNVQYLPPVNQPSSQYLPSNQYPKDTIQPPLSNSYLTPNKIPINLLPNSNSDYSDDHNVISDDFHYPLNGGYNIDPPQSIAKYEFEYHVNDDYGNDYGHKESRNGDDTQGIYTVLLPDGRKQIVRYTADQNGYKPVITYEEIKSGFDQGYQY